MKTAMLCGTPASSLSRVTVVAVLAARSMVAVSNAHRHAALTEEFESANAGSWNVERINGLVRQEFSKPEMQARMRDFNVILKLGTPADLAAFQKAEIAKWTRFVKEAGIEPEG